MAVVLLIRIVTCVKAKFCSLLLSNESIRGAAAGNLEDLPGLFLRGFPDFAA